MWDDPCVVLVDGNTLLSLCRQVPHVTCSHQPGPSLALDLVSNVNRLTRCTTRVPKEVGLSRVIKRWSGNIPHIGPA